MYKCNHRFIHYSLQHVRNIRRPNTVYRVHIEFNRLKSNFQQNRPAPASICWYIDDTRKAAAAARLAGTSRTKARFPFKRNRLRCVNENRKKRKRLRWQAVNHGCHCFDRAFLLAGACVCCVKLYWCLFLCYRRRLCRSAWAGRSRLSVCLSVCLLVRSITPERMIPKCSNLILV